MNHIKKMIKNMWLILLLVGLYAKYKNLPDIGIFLLLLFFIGLYFLSQYQLNKKAQTSADLFMKEYPNTPIIFESTAHLTAPGGKYDGSLILSDTALIFIYSFGIRKNLLEIPYQDIQEYSLSQDLIVYTKNQIELQFDTLDNQKAYELLVVKHPIGDAHE